MTPHDTVPSPGTTMRSTRQPLLVLAFVGTVIAVPALAQQPASYPPACDASKVSKADVERAHTVFLSGKQFLDESNYDKAVSYFNDAYSIDCSVHGILPIIATAYERKGDKARGRSRARRVPAARPERPRPRARRASHQEPERPARQVVNRCGGRGRDQSLRPQVRPPPTGSVGGTSEPVRDGGPSANTPSPAGDGTFTTRSRGSS